MVYSKREIALSSIVDNKSVGWQAEVIGSKAASFTYLCKVAADQRREV